MISTGELFRLVRGPITVAEPLGPYTGLRIGGTADYFIKPRDRQDLCRAFGYFRKHGFPFFILGRGSRLLVHEEGFRGTVIATEYLDRLIIDGEQVEADAGVSMPVLADRISRASLGGLGSFGRWAGTVGGALCLAERKEGGELPECLEWVDVLRNGRTRRLCNGELHAGIRTRGGEAEVILGAGFRFHRLSGRERHAVQKADTAVHPDLPVDPGAGGALSGRVFRDPPILPGQTGVSAGELLDACRLRGERCGGASFSELDANRIVNRGDASSIDVLNLVRLARESVHARFGLRLELELVLVGYNMNGNHGAFI